MDGWKEEGGRGKGGKRSLKVECHGPRVMALQ